MLVVNPDDVARGLSPDTPDHIAYEAARVADSWRRDLVARGVSFCMETVFSDPHGAKLDFLRECQSQGYAVVLVFIGLESLGGHPKPAIDGHLKTGHHTT